MVLSFPSEVAPVVEWPVALSGWDVSVCNTSATPLSARSVQIQTL